jgi:hypothetical protein
MWPGVSLSPSSGACLALAAAFFINLRSIESPERYLALDLGLVMLDMGGAILSGLIWPAKPKDPNAPVRGRTTDFVSR